MKNLKEILLVTFCIMAGVLVSCGIVEWIINQVPYKNIPNWDKWTSLHYGILSMYTPLFSGTFYIAYKAIKINKHLKDTFNNLREANNNLSKMRESIKQ